MNIYLFLHATELKSRGWPHCTASFQFENDDALTSNYERLDLGTVCLYPRCNKLHDSYSAPC